MRYLIVLVIFFAYILFSHNIFMIFFQVFIRTMLKDSGLFKVESLA